MNFDLDQFYKSIDTLDEDYTEVAFEKKKDKPFIDISENEELSHFFERKKSKTAPVSHSSILPVAKSKSKSKSRKGKKKEEMKN